LAASAASGFVVWILGLSVSAFLAHKAKRLVWAHRRVTATAVMAAAVLVWTITWIKTQSRPAYADAAPFSPSDPPNHPTGIPAGILPGRVVWVHDPEATSWNGTGNWLDDSNTDPEAVACMLSVGLQSLTGAADDVAAWDALFIYFNRVHGKGEIGYRPGEKVAIKLNLNQVNDHGFNGTRHYTSPQLALALLQSLVEHAGAAPENVTFYDASRYVPGSIFDKCRMEFPGVRFVDTAGGDGRVRAQRDESCGIRWSAPMTLETGGGNPTVLPTCVSGAAYLINLATLRGHNLAGVTLGAKNHFGTFFSSGPHGSSGPMNAGVHPYVCVHDDFHFGGHWDFQKRAMATYTPLVDLMGHRDLGGKTFLFLVDGLYATPDQSSEMNKNLKWTMDPFHNDWPSSLFLSQDGVAVESVCLDFLRSESTITWVRGNVDNYLHEAARADDPPSGTVYDPEGDGTRLSSLGVHEHWNNAVDKAYSRNLGSGQGIDLVKTSSVSAVKLAGPPSWVRPIGNYPNPFNGFTTILFEMQRPGILRCRVIDVAGRSVAVLYDEYRPAGRIRFDWDGRDGSGIQVPSGCYFMRIVTMERMYTHKMVLVR
jgi:hypothetical protein